MLLQYFFVFLCLHVVMSLQAPVKDLMEPPRFSLNLDLPEEERWPPILEHWNVTEVQYIMEGIIRSFTTNETYDEVETTGEYLLDYFPYQYRMEIKGIADYFELPIGQLVFLNIFYSVAGGCTSIVAQDNDGNIWHARNMDYPFTEQLYKMTAVVDFQSNGETLYTSTQFIGQVGTFTGQRPNAFTASFNQRNVGFGVSTATKVAEIVTALTSNENTTFADFLIRDVLSSEDTQTFESALSILSNQPQTAPNYYIIGGVGTAEGAVVSRSSQAAVDVWRLAPEQGRWFVLETNYDRWNPPPVWKDQRRIVGNNTMNNIGQDDIDLPHLLEVLSTYPICNGITIYTTLMSAANPDSYVTYMRSCGHVKYVTDAYDITDETTDETNDVTDEPDETKGNINAAASFYGAAAYVIASATIVWLENMM